ncbi:glycosyltransferase [Candidatus Woesearchaeota archaeon]|nr:glycosyltransferase [Candidatus Woesearchaeota archaeon]MBW3022164.1 glycosyltransferase [Candidatus Woesearchaeota archaeon]
MISLFIPMYNEEHVIEQSIPKVLEFLRTVPKDIKLIMLDDGSTDRTPELAKSLTEKYDKLYYQRHNGPSRRENLAQAMAQQDSDIIMFMDMDLSTDLCHIPELITQIENGYDIATGSRHVKGSKVKRNFSRYFISHGFKIFIKLYFGSKINDHECGFKAFKKEVIKDLVNELGYDHKKERKMFWDTEMFLRAQRKGYRIKEIPIRWTEGKKSALRIRTELSMLPYILRLRKRLG